MIGLESYATPEMDRAAEAASYFRTLGDRVRSHWRQHAYDERAFAGIASDALRSDPPALGVRYRDLIDALLFHDLLPTQPADQSFGQPPIVVYSHPRFFIEVLCWMDATTTIHQHAFSGAFHVLEGSSVHTQFAFDLRDRINGSLGLGELRLLHSELLEAGDTREIHSGAQMIHGLFHLASPSISVVVRTRGEPDQRPQFDYLPPFVAIDPLSLDAQDQQRRQLLTMLLATDRSAFERVTSRLFAEADLPDVFQLLRFVHERCVSAPFDVELAQLDPWLERARERFGARIDALYASVATTARIADMQMRRAEIIDPDHRFFLALLINLPHRDELLRLVRERYDSEPEVLVRRWLRELTRASGSELQLLDVVLSAGEGEQAQLRELLDATVSAMLRGAAGAALVAEVAHLLPEIAEDAVPELERALQGGALHTLFNAGPKQ